eukprot:SAG25_NODE_296_length_10244_cov_67.215081_3_plen_159_part_00
MCVEVVGSLVNRRACRSVHLRVATGSHRRSGTAAPRSALRSLCESAETDGHDILRILDDLIRKCKQDALLSLQGPVRLPGWCNYDHRPYFAGPPTPLKSSVELQNSARRMDTYHPLKTVEIRGFWPRYATRTLLRPPTPQNSASGSQDPHTYPPSCGF